MDVQTIISVIGYVICIVLAFICGRLNKEVHNNRDTIADLRERVSDCIPNSGELEGSKHRFEDTVAEIRKNGQFEE